MMMKSMSFLVPVSRLVPLVGLAVLVFMAPVFALAQGEPGPRRQSVGIAAELSVPVGDFSSIAGIGYGGILKHQYGVDLRSAVTVSAGYLVWSKEDVAGGTIQPKAFEAMLGGKYYFTQGFFGSLEGGVYVLSFTHEGQVLGVEGDTWRFMLPVGFGYQVNGFEIGARYYLLSAQATSFSFTLGYNWIL